MPAHHSDTPPEGPPPRRSWLLPVGLGLGGLVIGGGVAGALAAKPLINQRLMPLVAEQVEDMIERPVQLGELEGLSLGGIRIGPTELPAIPTDASSARVDTITIGVDWRALLLERTLKPTVTLIDPELALVQGEDGQWFQLTLPEQPESEGPITTELQSIRIRNATVSATTEIQDPAAVVPRSQVRLEGVDVDANFRHDDAQTVAFDLSGTLEQGSFQVQGEGQIANQAVNALVMTENLPTTGVNLLLPGSLGLAAGTLHSNLDVAVRLQQPDDPIDAQGTARFENGEVRAAQLTQPVTDINSRLRFQGQRVTLEDTGLQLGDINLTAAGDVHLQEGYNLTAQVPSVTLANLQQLLAVELPVEAQGRFQVATQVTGPIEDPQIQGTLTNREAARVDRLTLNTIAADFALNRETFTLARLQVNPATGGAITGRGQVDLASLDDPGLDFALNANLPADGAAARYGLTLPNDAVIGSLVATGQVGGSLKNPQAQLQWQLVEGTYPGQGQLALAGTTLTVDNTRLQVAAGTVTATALAQLDGGDWRANLRTQQVPVDRFVPQAQGQLSANIDAAGNLSNLDPAAIQVGGEAAIADGNLQLTPDSPPLLPAGDWNTAFRWTGEGLQVERFTAPGISADGFIAATVTPTPAIGDFGLNVDLQRYDLAPLEGFAPAQVRSQLRLGGLVSFRGRLQGNLDNPELVGDARLENVGLNGVRFEGDLTGPVQYDLATGGSTDLEGNGSRIAASLPAATVLPEQFVIRHPQFQLQGTVVDRQLQARLEEFPLEALEIDPATLADLDLDLGRVSGVVSADVTADLTDLSQPRGMAAVDIQNPAVGDIAATAIVANLSYADGTATLTRGDLQLRRSLYRLQGQATLPTLDFRGDLQIIPGHIEDILATLQWDSFEAVRAGLNANADDAGAEALATQPVATSPGSLQAQLEVLEGILAQQTAVAEQPQLPRLDTLTGEFTGRVQVQGNLNAPEAITAKFNLAGDDWAWGEYRPTNRFAVAGQYTAATLTLEPDQNFVQVDSARAEFEGSGSLEQLDGQLAVTAVPVTAAEAFVALPLEVDGTVAVTANLGGSLTNPLVAGEVAVDNARLNRQPLETVAVNFDYQNAHLLLDGMVAADDRRRLTLTGDIPYALPLMTVQPRSDQMDVQVAIANDGLGFINLVTADRLRWEGGRGDVLLQVQGPITDPVVTGNAAFQNGVVAVEGLSQTISDINGKARFNLSELGIEQLQAQFGDGRLTVDGTLPLLLAARPKQVSGLAIDLDQVPVDYDGLISATLDGQVLIGGTALAPRVGGQMEVDKGVIRVTRILRNLDALPVALEDPEAGVSPPNPYREMFYGPQESAATNQPPSYLEQIWLDNFVVTLKDRLLISGQPFFNLTSSGNLRLNGTPVAPRPEGVITLDTGWINLFSNQFRLVSSAPNTVTFTPEDGLDPFLDLRMQSRVQDNNVTKVPESASTFAGAEVSESAELGAVGDVEFLQVYANVYGPLSQLQEDIELTSEPARGQQELLALISSNVVGGLSSASINQLAGFLGAGSLATFGSDVASAIGLRSFSVFPTTDTSSESAAGVGIGMEASFAIGSNLGVSFLEILNSGNPPKFGVDYRFTPNLQLRGSTNLAGDDEVRLEYRVRF